MSSGFVSPGHGDVLSPVRTPRTDDFPTVEVRIQKVVEYAVQNCGSAAALARELAVKPPTVSQWRTGKKKPDAVHLMRIQDLVSNGCGLHQLG
jgi:hypothetical protein